MTVLLIPRGGTRVLCVKTARLVATQREFARSIISDYFFLFFSTIYKFWKTISRGSWVLARNQFLEVDIKF